MRRLYDDHRCRPPAVPVPAGVVHEWDGPVWRTVGESEGFVSGPRDVGVRNGELDRLIARQRDYFAARGEPVVWKVCEHDRPADLGRRLRRAGFVAEPSETVMFGLAEEMVTSPVLPEGVVLRQVTAPAEMRRIAAMESVVWGEDWSGIGEDLVHRVAAAPDDTAVFVAEAGGEMVSAAWLVFLGAGVGFAGLCGGSTLPAWRGRGVYRALVAARAERAVAQGVRFLQVAASDDSAPILQRLNFRAVATTTPYVWSPPR